MVYFSVKGNIPMLEWSRRQGGTTFFMPGAGASQSVEKLPLFPSKTGLNFFVRWKIN
jgi:hypothetical protein